MDSIEARKPEQTLTVDSTEGEQTEQTLTGGQHWGTENGERSRHSTETHIVGAALTMDGSGARSTEDGGQQ